MATLKLGSTTAISESSGAITYDAGTIGSNINYPAGMVVQVIHNTIAGSGSITTSATGNPSASDSAIMTATITTKKANSKFWIHGSMESHINPNSGNLGTYSDLWRIISGGTDVHIDYVAKSHIEEYNSDDTFHMSWPNSWSYYYSPSLAAGTSLTVGIKIQSAGGGAYWHYDNGGGDPTITITEIQA